MIKNLAELFAAGALRSRAVEVCGVSVKVRELSVANRAEIVRLSEKDPAAVPQAVVRMCVLGEGDALLFGADADDQVAQLRPELVDGLAQEIMRLSGLVEPPGKG